MKQICLTGSEHRGEEAERGGRRDIGGGREGREGEEGGREGRMERGGREREGRMEREGRERGARKDGSREGGREGQVVLTGSMVKQALSQSRLQPDLRSWW